MSYLFPTAEENAAIYRQREREALRANLERCAQCAAYIETLAENIWCQVQFSDYGHWQQAYPQYKPWVADAQSQPDGQIHLVIHLGEPHRYVQVYEDWLMMMEIGPKRANAHLHRSLDKLKAHYDEMRPLSQHA